MEAFRIFALISSIVVLPFSPLFVPELFGVPTEAKVLWDVFEFMAMVVPSVPSRAFWIFVLISTIVVLPISDYVLEFFGSDAWIRNLIKIWTLHIFCYVYFIYSWVVW